MLDLRGEPGDHADVGTGGHRGPVAVTPVPAGLQTVGPTLGPALAREFTAPAFLAILGIAAVVTLLLFAEHPRVSRRTVVALLPWMVVGAALSVLAAEVDYPPVVRPALEGPGAYLTTYAIVCSVWFVALQFARGSRHHGWLPTYLAASGVGVATVLLGTLLGAAGQLTGGQVFWLAVTPIAAAVVAGVVLVLLGLWYTEAAAYTGVVGGLVVFGHALAAIGTAVAIVADAAGHTALSWALLDLLATVGAAGLVGLDGQLLWAWGFVWTKLIVATLAIVALTTYTRRRPDRGNLLLGLVAAVGVAGGVTALLSLVVA